MLLKKKIIYDSSASAISREPKAERQ